MDLYACGNNRLLQPNACDRYFTDRPNPCKHVPSRSVDSRSACPHMALIPKLILQAQHKIDIHQLAAENVIVTENQYLHARDDGTLEENTIQELSKHVKDQDI